MIYYISNSGSNSNEGTQLFPFQTISKLNSVTLVPGDSVLLKRGDVFSEALPVNQSGSAGNVISFGAYGTGANPIITGFVTPTWTDDGGSIWAYTNAVLGARINIVTINGIIKPIGRFPNTGYRNITSHSGNASITDADLTGSPSFVGAEIVIRKAHWVIDRWPITAHVSGTLSYTDSDGDYDPENGYGYFVQNHINCLDSYGEWCYNPTSHKLSMYSLASPVGVKASFIASLVIIQEKSYINFSSINLEGANEFAAYIEDSNNLNFVDCNIKFCQNGIRAYSSSYISVVGSLESINNNGIELRPGCDHATIRVSIKSIGMIAGAGESGDNTYQGIIVVGDNNMVELCKISNIGYNPISFQGSNNIAQKNLINRFCITKDDGAGVYTYSNSGTIRDIKNNIILNGIGAAEGTTGEAETFGVYIDDDAKSVSISENTVANCSAGIYLHNAQDVEVLDNVLFNNGSQIRLKHDGNGDTFTGLNIQGNTIHCAKKNQLALEIISSDDDIETYGTIDNNFYSRPRKEGSIISKNISDIVDAFTLEAWQSDSGKDAESVSTPIGVGVYSRLIYNDSPASKVVPLDMEYKDSAGATKTGSITLPTFTGSVLMSTNPDIGAAVSGRSILIIE